MFTYDILLFMVHGVVLCFGNVPWYIHDDDIPINILPLFCKIVPVPILSEVNLFRPLCVQLLQSWTEFLHVCGEMAMFASWLTAIVFGVDDKNILENVI